MIGNLRPRGRSLDTHTVERVFGGVRPAPESVKKSWRFKLWQSLRAFRRTDVQFGIKVGVGAIIFAIPAFAWTMRPTFSAWRGEWGLITYLVIMNKSVGGTTVTIPLRFVGTFLGAVLAYVAWTIFPYNPYLLSATGFLTSCACFYIILTWKTRNLFGRFILLTFNLVALYSYSISQNDNENDDDEGGTNPVVGYIAVHRFLAVTAGVLWAVCISALILPSSARRRLRVGLSIQWLRMGLIWKADPINTVARKGPIPGAGAVRPRTMSIAATDRAADDLLSQMETINGSGASGATLGPNGTILTDKDIVGIYGERELQGTMIELQTLLGHAPMELRIKGPFPLAEYKQMMQSTQKILDAYQNISVLISKNPNPTSKEYELIERTEADRREICGRVFLYFYLAASAIRMGLPLPDILPSVVHAVDRMLVTLNEHRLASLDSTADDEDFVLFYTYTLVTLSIVEELTKITQTIQKLFGAIDDDKLFVG